MMLMDRSPQLEVALQACLRSASILLGYYAGTIFFEEKADETPVSIADKQAEELIRAHIARIYPEHGFLGEEFGGDTESEWLWIIDPLDGTKSFLRHIPLFATEIALAHWGEIYLGVSHMPAVGEIMFAERKKGTFLNYSQVNVSSTAHVEQAHVSLAGLKHFPQRLGGSGLMNLLCSFGRIRAYGDAYPYHLLASGRLDAVIEDGIKIWDIAALTIAVEEAGGTVTDLEGQPVTTSTTSILATNGRLHEKILRLVQPTI